MKESVTCGVEDIKEDRSSLNLAADKTCTYLGSSIFWLVT
jgi:hypothetical protein